MTVTVAIPALLQDCVGGRRSIEVEATRLDEALAGIKAQFPLLRPHVWDDAGNVRQHVLIFYNNTALRWIESLQLPLAAGDHISIVQAISGG